MVALGANACIIGRNVEKTENMAKDIATARPGARVLGIGAKLVAVPYERLRAAGGGERNRWTLTGAASRDDLNRMPTFSYDGAAGRG